MSMGAQPYVWVRMGAYVTRWVPAGVLLGPMYDDTCSPWISDRGGFERPSRAAALVSALTWPLPPRLAGSREIKLGLVCCPPPTIPPCYPFTRHISVSHAPLFPYRSLALSLSLSRSLSAPLAFYFRQSVHSASPGISSPSLPQSSAHLSVTPRLPTVPCRPIRPGRTAVPQTLISGPPHPHCCLGHNNLISLTPTISPLACRH